MSACLCLILVKQERRLWAQSAASTRNCANAPNFDVPYSAARLAAGPPGRWCLSVGERHGHRALPSRQRDVRSHARSLAHARRGRGRFWNLGNALHRDAGLRARVQRRLRSAADHSVFGGRRVHQRPGPIPYSARAKAVGHSGRRRHRGRGDFGHALHGHGRLGGARSSGMGHRIGGHLRGRRA